MKSEIVKNFKEIKEDYKWDSSIFNDDEEKVSRLKKVINTKLSLVDKTIILLYVDCLSYRKLGQRFGLSHMTIRREVIRIKRIILEELDKCQQED